MEHLTGVKIHFATVNNTKVVIICKMLNDAKLLMQTATCGFHYDPMEEGDQMFHQTLLKQLSNSFSPAMP